MKEINEAIAEMHNHHQYNQLDALYAKAIWIIQKLQEQLHIAAGSPPKKCPNGHIFKNGICVNCDQHLSLHSSFIKNPESEEL